MTTFPNVTVGPVHRASLSIGPSDYDSRTLTCYACSARIGSHHETYRLTVPQEQRDQGIPWTAEIMLCRTTLDSTYVPHGARVDGLAAYRETPRATTRRPVSVRHRDDFYRTLLRDTPARFLPSRGPGLPVHPPVHIWCRTCEAPQRVPIICDDCLASGAATG